MNLLYNVLYITIIFVCMYYYIMFRLLPRAEAALQQLRGAGRDRRLGAARHKLLGVVEVVVVVVVHLYIQYEAS